MMVIAIVKIHGNWCGPNWTAGRRISALDYAAAGGQFDEPCIDKLDCACRARDRDWETWLMQRMILIMRMH